MRECFRSRAAACAGSPTARCAVCGMKSRTSRRRRSLQRSADPSARARIGSRDSAVNVGRIRQDVRDAAIRVRDGAEIARRHPQRCAIHGEFNRRGRCRDRPSLDLDRAAMVAVAEHRRSHRPPSAVPAPSRVVQPPSAPHGGGLRQPRAPRWIPGRISMACSGMRSLHRAYVGRHRQIAEVRHFASWVPYHNCPRHQAASMHDFAVRPQVSADD